MNNLLQKVFLTKSFMEHDHTKKDDDYITMVKHVESICGEIDPLVYSVPIGILNKSDNFTIYNSLVADSVYRNNKEIWSSLYDLDINLENYSEEMLTTYADEKDSVAIRTVGKDILTILNVSEFTNTYLIALKNGAVDRWLMDNFINKFDMFDEVFRNMNLVNMFDARFLLVISDILRTDALGGLRDNKMLDNRFAVLNDIYNAMIQSFYDELFKLKIVKSSNSTKK